jgi:putative ABC transport system substrate-binding protein
MMPHVRGSKYQSHYLRRSNRVKRRELIALLGGLIAWPLGADAQQPARVPRVGLLWPGSSGPDRVIEAFGRGLREHGYVEGQNIVVERVDAGFKPERFAQLATELVQRKVDVIVVWSSSPALAVKEATTTIPIVVNAIADPVRDGLVSSLGRPGGNLTGNTFIGPELVTKRLSLLREALPGLSRVAALWHPNAYGERTVSYMVKETEDAAQLLGVKLQLASARGPEDFDSAFAAMSDERAEALIVLLSPMFYSELKRIAKLAEKNRLPASYAPREFAEAGGLMSYGADLSDLARDATTYVDKILKGSKPADLPVQQPTKFELVINLRAAKALGLTVPPALLARADEVIE